MILSVEIIQPHPGVFYSALNAGLCFPFVNKYMKLWCLIMKNGQFEPNSHLCGDE